MKLGTALSDSFKTYAKKPLLFSGIYVAAMLILIIFNVILVPSGALLTVPAAIMTGDAGAIIGFAGLLFLIYIAVAIVAGALSLGGMIKASSEVYAGHKTTIMDCLKFAFNRVWDYIILGLRVFWYSLAWVLILIMIIAPFFLNGTANAQAPAGEMPAELQEMMQELEGMEGMEALESMDFEAMTAYGIETPGYMNNPILGIIFLVLGIIVIYRLLRAVFAFYVYFDNPKIDTKKALEESLKITKGNIWRLIGYLIVFGLIIGIGSGIISSVILDPLARALSGNMEALVMWSLVLEFILAAVVAPITILFYYVTYKGWSKE
jgi:hypothetical protein